MEVILKKKSSFEWEHSSQLNIKKVVDENLTEESILASLELGNNNFENYINKMKNFFSFIFETDTHLYAVVDHLKTFPLFYTEKNGFILSDDSSVIYERLYDKSVNYQAIVELKMTGYVTGKDTLIEEIKQLEAGEYLTYNKSTAQIEVKTYTTPNQVRYEINENELLKKLDEIHLKIFKKLISGIGNRQIVLPLSGGYDSRIIAYMLKRIGYTDVICFTYGEKQHWEVIASKEIAAYLGFKWIFIPYSKEKWRKWYESEEKEKFFKYTGSLYTTPHVLDVLAINELKESNLIPKNSVFVPGHTALLSFSGFPEKNQFENISESLFEKHYSLRDWSFGINNKFKSSLSSKLITTLKDSKMIDENIFYEWEIKERHAKFICNSVKTYEFYGYQWRMPLWEKELVEFWSKTPQEFRKGKKLYKKYFNEILSDSKVEIQKPNFKSDQKNINIIKKSMKKNRLIFLTLRNLNAVKIYFDHPMKWFSIMNFYSYLIGLKGGARNINSFIADDYINKVLNLDKAKSIEKEMHEVE